MHQNSKLDHNIKFVSYSALQVAIGIEMKFIKNLLKEKKIDFKI